MCRGARAACTCAHGLGHVACAQQLPVAAATAAAMTGGGRGRGERTRERARVCQYFYTTVLTVVVALILQNIVGTMANRALLFRGEASPCSFSWHATVGSQFEIWCCAACGRARARAAAGRRRPSGCESLPGSCRIFNAVGVSPPFGLCCRQSTRKNATLFTYVGVFIKQIPWYLHWQLLLRRRGRKLLKDACHCN